jgi:antitoxin ParD1/3/4
MAKNISISLGNHFEAFVSEQMMQGQYNSASEVVQASLRLLEEREVELKALRQALIEGEESGDDGILDMEEIRLEAKKKAGLFPHH